MDFARLANAVLAVALLTNDGAAHPPAPLPRADGYFGCWYFNQATGDEYKYKYSGGFATYPQQLAPIAIYAKEVNKTFFVYGGKNPAGDSILHMVSYFDHATGLLPRPAILLDKKTSDAHDNPVLLIDAKGHLLVFSNAHGTSRPSFIHRSKRPFDITEFELVRETNFSYGQPWLQPGGAMLFLHTKYRDGGRSLFAATSLDGATWSEPKAFARIKKGDYMVSWQNGHTLGVAFDYHPEPLGLNARTNLYYLATDDGGKTWKRADGHVVELPLREPNNSALVRDFQGEGKLVYIKDVNFDAAGRPVILFLTSRGWEPGPRHGPHEWHTARWTGSAWDFQTLTTSDHNYDHGSLYVEADGQWRVIAPTEPGPQPFGTGGEMVMWVSRDTGRSWTKVKQLTTASPRNHTYARRPLHAHPDFYAIWADGDARKRSESHLYFTDRAGSQVWRLPPRFENDFERPVVVK